MTATTDNRPAWYDEKVTEYMPFIRRMANVAARYSRQNGSAEDIEQDIVAELLAKWSAYDKQYKFGTWVGIMAKNVYLAKRQYRSAQKRRLDAGAYRLEFGCSSSPSQEDYTELSATLGRLSGTRDSEALMRFAMGDELHDIGADLGVSKQRVFQLIERERTHLRRAAA
ncbi:hypothetical protein KNLIENLN_00030 [Sinorhizobium phage NV1.1.1]|nr:hypothetical protein KNLIENLN_00030 [Sinorhizobium phage NV1.1.1]